MGRTAVVNGVSVAFEVIGGDRGRPWVITPGGRLSKVLPNARLVEPPWGDNEWNERSAARPGGRGEGLFTGWPQLAPQLQAWADEVLGKPIESPASTDTAHRHGAA